MHTIIQLKKDLEKILSINSFGTPRKNTKQNNTKQNNTKQNNTKQNNTLWTRLKENVFKHKYKIAAGVVAAAGAGAYVYSKNKQKNTKKIITKNITIPKNINNITLDKNNISVVTWNCFGNSINNNNPFEFYHESWTNNKYLFNQLNSKLKEKFNDIKNNNHPRIFSFAEKMCTFNMIELLQNCLNNKDFKISSTSGTCGDNLFEKIKEKYKDESNQDKFKIKDQQLSTISQYIDYYRKTVFDTLKEIIEKNKEKVNDTKLFLNNTNNDKTDVIQQQLDLLFKDDHHILFLQECPKQLADKLESIYYCHKDKHHDHKLYDKCIFYHKKYFEKDIEQNSSETKFYITCKVKSKKEYGSKYFRLYCCHLDSNKPLDDYKKLREDIRIIKDTDKNAIVILGMDSNINDNKTMNDFDNWYRNNKLSGINSGLTIKDKSNYYTCNKTRSYLQTQISKADKTDKSFKDFILTTMNVGITQIVNNNNNTFNGNLSMPNSTFPSDHAMVITTLNFSNVSAAPFKSS